MGSGSCPVVGCLRGSVEFCVVLLQNVPVWLAGRAQRVSGLAVGKSVQYNVNFRVIHTAVICSELARGTMP